MERKLTAIMAADVVGYSRMMGADEAGTLVALQALRAEFIDPTIGKHRGRIVKLIGDGTLVEFASVVDALDCAVAIQREMAGRNSEHPVDRRIAFRIGINVGDIIVDGDDIYGNGVNIAARLEALAEPGGICLSGRVVDQVEKNVDVGFAFLGPQTVKNIEKPVNAYKVLLDPADAGKVVGAPKSPGRPKFIAAVVALLVAAGGAGIWYHQTRPEREPAPTDRIDLAHPGKTSIAVLPLDNLSGDPDQELLASGLTEDFIAALSKVPELLVIARNSTETYKGKSVDVRQVAKDLGVRHVLEGSVQRSGDRLRITTQLIDGISGAHLWAERYDREVEDFFELQDEIVRKVLIELQVKLTLGDSARVLSRGTRNLEAWLLSRQAETEAFKFRSEANIRARELYAAASRADPQWAHPIGGLAWTYREAVRRGWSKSADEDRRQGIELARKAIDMDPNEPLGYMQLGNFYIEQGDFEEGIALREKALELAPNNFYALAGLAWQLPFVGQEKRALELYRRAKSVNPLHPAWFLAAEGFALHFDGQHERAIEAFKQSLARSDRPDVRGRLAAVYADLGRIDEAHEQIRIVLEESPDTKVEELLRVVRFQDPKRTEWYAGLLRKAGLPE